MSEFHSDDLDLILIQASFFIAIYLLKIEYIFQQVKLLTVKQFQLTISSFGIIFIIDKVLLYSFGNFSDGLEDPIENTKLILFVYLVLLAPIAEEVIFRGCIYANFKKRDFQLLGRVVSSVLWTLIHFSSSYFLHYYLAIFISGLILSYLYDKNNGLSIVIVVHALSNLGYFFTII
ncbi:CPBP family intramembrane glutamic endopeptidase [Thalassotalea fusca]